MHYSVWVDTLAYSTQCTQYTQWCSLAVLSQITHSCNAPNRSDGCNTWLWLLHTKTSTSYFLVWALCFMPHENCTVTGTNNISSFVKRHFHKFGNTLVVPPLPLLSQNGDCKAWEVSSVPHWTFWLFWVHHLGTYSRVTICSKYQVWARKFAFVPTLPLYTEGV